jgi:GT2 family glycosyltransferase
MAHRDLLPRPRRLPGGIHFASANVAIRRSLFDRLGPFGFPGEFHGGGEDTEFASRIAYAGAAVAVDDSWYVRHEVGSSFWATCRRYWRYGYVNACLWVLTTARNPTTTCVSIAAGGIWRRLNCTEASLGLR